MRAQILTPYGLRDDSYYPLVADLLTAPGESCVDATGAPTTNIVPFINLLTADVVCQPATLLAIESDSRFEVIWSE